MLVATAGHIDHGKTTLVRALTGVDTDRLPEEKARGISIDIGFAYWTTPSGQLVGFVDVPGHERFVRHMLAGVTAIDFALLVVAADDGVMPQTREHLQILDLLGVREGLAVITKTDRAGDARTAEVTAQVRELLRGTTLQGMPALPVAAPTGAGLPELRAALEQAALVRRERGGRERNLRYSIDRAFSVAGSGTVVTGTVLDGRVAVGDRLRLSPAGTEVRVRAVHKQGHASQDAAAGERCALNIVGADPAQAARGNWLLAPRAHAPTERIDARLRALPSEAQALRHWMPVHLHMGTADVTARLVMPGLSIAPGEGGFAQIVLDHAVAAAHGDRFIIRDASAQRTIGGGTVLDPFPSRSSHGRRERDARDARLAALDLPAPADTLAQLLRTSPGGVDVEVFRRTYNLAPAALQRLLDEAGAESPEGDRTRAFGHEHIAALRAAVTSALAGFHAASPHLPGMDLDALARAAAPRLASRVRLAAVRDMAARGELLVQGSLATLPSHVPAARPGDEQIWRTLLPLYREWGMNVPLVREVATRSGVAEAKLRDFLKHRARVGEMVRVTAERYMPRDTLGLLAERVLGLAGTRPGGRFSVADFRDFAGVGRNTAIEVLELFDRLGITMRGGDTRSVQNPDYRAALRLAAQPGVPRATTASSFPTGSS